MKTFKLIHTKPNITPDCRLLAPDLILLPDYDFHNVERALKDIYMKQDVRAFLEILKCDQNSKFVVKEEVRENETDQKPYTYDIEDENGEYEPKVELSEGEFENDDIDTKDFSAKQSEVKVAKLSNRSSRKVSLYGCEEIEDVENEDEESDDWFESEQRNKSPTKKEMKKGKLYIKCRLCGVMCNERKNLITHMKHNHGINPTTKLDKQQSCQYCEKEVKNKEMMNQHLTRVHREEVLLNHPEILLVKPCEDCDEMFYNVLDLDKHSRIAHNKSVRTWQCKICHQTLEDQNSYLQHKQTAHQIERNTNIELHACPYCDIKRIREGSLLNHIFSSHKDKRTLHSELTSSFKCDQCPKEFYSKIKLRKHKKSEHSGDIPCKICSNISSNLAAHKRHLILHATDAKPCPYCDKMFKLEVSFNHHLAQMHRDKVILQHPEIVFNKPCQYCEELFYGVHDLDKHSRTVHSKSARSFKCNICEVSFEKVGQFRNHRESAHMEELLARGFSSYKKTRECPYCQKELGKSIYKGHIFRVHKDMLHLHPEITVKFSCTDCDLKFCDKSAYLSHMKNNHSESVKCPICDRVFKNENNLKQHSTEHSNDVHTCDSCGKTYKSKRKLDVHVKGVHLGLKGDLKCTQCSQRFQREETLQKHILEWHCGIQYICSQCPNSFTNPDARNSHERRVHDEKVLKCSECDKMFSTNNTLKHHIRIVHVKPKTLICPHCGEGFFQSESYKAHVNRHTNNRQFPCETCGKKFLSAKGLKGHMNSHTRPYKCDQCDFSTSGSTELKEHNRRVHEGIKISCRYNCGWECWQMGNKHRHEIKCQLNPMPGAPYTVAMGTASSYILENFNASLQK